MNIRLHLFVSILLLLHACQDNNALEEALSKSSEEPSFAFKWEAMAQTLIDRMDLQAGEAVFFVAKPGKFDTLIAILRPLIVKAGAEDLGVISVTADSPKEWETDFVKGAQGKNAEELVDYFQGIDLGIMFPGAVPTDTAYAAMQEVLDQGQGRTIHFHWSGAYDLAGQEIPIDNKVNACYQKAFLETDYEKLKKVQEDFEFNAREEIIRVTTPLGTDIRFDIAGRPVTRQDGDASAERSELARNLIEREIELPAGAIRVAPYEPRVNGKIAFPSSDWNGTRVEGLVLTFEKGKVIEYTAEKGIEAVEAVFEEYGEVAKSFREFALGMNPLLAIQENGSDPWIPYYGYGSGIVRLSLGDNAELGGDVTGGYVRWNFFTDATVQVGEEVWVKDGKWVREVM